MTTKCHRNGPSADSAGPSKVSNRSVRCSLVIPVFNAQNILSICLEAALNQTIPPNEYEIIVVDDGSTDGTSEIAFQYPVRLIQQTNSGPASARNRGANAARGEIVVFTDIDCIMAPDFLENMIEPIESDSSVAGVQGIYRTEQAKFIARFVQAEIEQRYQLMKRRPTIDFIGTYAAAYRKSCFQKAGGFDSVFTIASGEDTELSYALQETGNLLVLCPNAVTAHTHPDSLWHYLRVKFNRGFWRVRLYRLHPGKAFKDSYTPQSLKLQVVLSPIFVPAVMMSLLSPIFGLLCGAILVLFVLWSIPLARNLKRPSTLQRASLPFLLILRAHAVFLGLLAGVARGKWRN